MPSKESLERGRKYNESVHACSCRAIPHNTEMQNFCLSCTALADLLDEASREARETTMQSAVQIAASYANVITSPFCRETVAIADCMIGAAKEIERALLVRLAQLREGKT